MQRANVNQLTSGNVIIVALPQTCQQPKKSPVNGIYLQMPLLDNEPNISAHIHFETSSETSALERRGREGGKEGATLGANWQPLFQLLLLLPVFFLLAEINGHRSEDSVLTMTQ